MNFLSLNLNGIGGDPKANWVRNLKMENDISFLAIQETKISCVSNFLVKKCWGNSGFEFDCVGADGLSGGILCIWDPGLFNCQQVVKDPNFLLIRGGVNGAGIILNIVNVYAPQDINRKKILWSRLEAMKGLYEGVWIILGDFNAVRFPEERKNSRFNSLCARNFNDFIFASNLHEYAMKGRRFTYVSKNGGKCSKIDRVLVCHDFIKTWSNACYMSLPRYLSDHGPVVLILKSSNFGPKPFRFFNSWLDRLEFDSLIRKANEEFSFTGPLTD